MKRTTMTVRHLSLAASAIVACTPGIEDYPRELEEAFCDWQHECHAYERRRDCIDASDIDQDPQFDYLLRAAAAGRIAYDRDAADACLDAVRDRDCEYVSDVDDAEEDVCDRVFRGQVGRNEPCLSTAECAGNAVCGFDPGCSDQCCVGACRVLPDPREVGEPCGGSNVECVASAFCNFDGMTGLQTCVARVKVGGDCSFGQTCVEGAACDGERCRETPVAEAGEPCGDPLVECAKGTRCVYDAAAGRPYCLTPAQLGAPCDPDGGAGCARFDTFCDPVSRLCTLLPGPGQGCGAGQCLPYATCSGDVFADAGDRVEPPTCVAKASEGGACGFHGADEPYVECLGDLQCVDDTCERREPLELDECEIPE